MSLFVGVMIQAQTVVTGKVVDRKGNPIPGAKVEIPKSNESALTELDGSFSLSTQQPKVKKVNVYYVGMQTKVQRVSPDMLIKLSKTNWWNQKPDKYRWFLGVDVAFPQKGMKNPSFGIMAGRMKNIGFYVRGVYSKEQETEYDINVSRPSEWLTGEKKVNFTAATAGIIVRLFGPIYYNFGLGYISNKVSWEMPEGTYASGGNYLNYAPDSYEGMGADTGISLCIGKRILVNAGGFIGDTPATSGCVGLCYIF